MGLDAVKPEAASRPDGCQRLFKCQACRSHGPGKDFTPIHLIGERDGFVFSFNFKWSSECVSLEPQSQLRRTCRLNEGREKEWARQSDRNAAGIPRNQASAPRPRPHFPPSLFANPYGVLTCGTMEQGELFCDHNARKRYLSPGFRGPRSGEQSGRKPEQVPTSCENILAHRGRGQREGSPTATRLSNHQNQVPNQQID